MVLYPGGTGGSGASIDLTSYTSSHYRDNVTLLPDKDYLVLQTGYGSGTGIFGTFTGATIKSFNEINSEQPSSTKARIALIHTTSSTVNAFTNGNSNANYAYSHFSEI